MARKHRSIILGAAGAVFASALFAGSLSAQEFPRINSLEVRGGFAYLDDGPRATSWVADINLGRLGESKFSPFIGASYWHTNRLGFLKAPGGHLGLRFEPLEGGRLHPFVHAKALGHDLSAKGGGAARDEEWSGFSLGAGLGAGLAFGIDEKQHIRLMLEGEKVFIKDFGHWGLRAGFAVAGGIGRPEIVAVAPVPPSPVDEEKLRTAEKAAADARSELNKVRSEKSAADARAAKAERELEAALRELGRLMKDVVAVEQTNRGVVITLGKGLFGFDKYNLSPRAQDEVARIAAVVKHFADKRIMVEGHTDSVGPEQYNQGLSERRAKSVADALAAAGVDASRMEIVGHSLRNPVADNKDSKGRAQNRRVEVVIVGARLPGN